MFFPDLVYYIQDNIISCMAVESVLVNPELVDMDIGLIIVPMLYAAQKNPILRNMKIRGFKRNKNKFMALDHMYMYNKAI